MFTSKQFRAKAAEYGKLAKGAGEPGAMRDYQKQERNFTEHANNEDWLANNFDYSLQPDGASATLADEEEHVLRCLGAAVLLQWSTLPIKSCRGSFFDNAGSVGELLQTSAVRGQIARFVHKDDEARPKM